MCLGLCFFFYKMPLLTSSLSEPRESLLCLLLLKEW
jgi:hypothetical protein